MSARGYPQLLWAVMAVLTIGSFAVQAQALRDPTVAPLEAQPSARAADGSLKAGLGPLGAEGMAVVVKDGQPFLVNGTRLVGVGQKVGKYRVERITETEVWLREGRSITKLTRFSGISRTAVVLQADCIVSPLEVPPKSPLQAKTKSVGQPATISPPATACAVAQP
jgi:hypothetical protein